MMYNIPVFEQRLRNLAQGFKKRYGELLDYDVEEEIARFKQYREDLAPYVIDAVDFMANAQKKGYPILVEGAQALLLDINMGNYPYVTSSSCAIGGAIAGVCAILSDDDTLWVITRIHCFHASLAHWTLEV
jgi:adenylosuccinate synthase